MTLFLVKILVAAIAFFLLGILWYSSLAFGPNWAKLMKKTGSKKSKIGIKTAHAVSVLCLFLSCLVMGILIIMLGIAGPGDGALFGMVLGLLLVGTTLLSEALYMGQPSGLFLINASYRVLGFILAGALIAP